MDTVKRLLVVDDDVDFADSVADLLRSDGHLVTVAYSGDAAVGLTRAQAFDLTLVDMQMPGLDGVHSLRAILDLRPTARVVMMTGYSVPERLGQAVAIGASSVMQKPLDLSRLHELIDSETAPLLVLVAEDDVDFAETLCGILQDSGYTVMLANSGHEAVERAAKRRPDLLLLDLRMPGMGGIEVFKELASRGLDLPTIVLSAYVDEERESLDADLGGVPPEQIVRKPVQADHLLQLVAQVAGAA
jgi:CheY-like chemotaxis protein